VASRNQGLLAFCPTERLGQRKERQTPRGIRLILCMGNHHSPTACSRWRNPMPLPAARQGERRLVKWMGRLALCPPFLDDLELRQPQGFRLAFLCRQVLEECGHQCRRLLVRDWIRWH